MPYLGESDWSSMVALTRGRADRWGDDLGYTFLHERDGEDTLRYGDLDLASRAIAAHLQADGLAGERALLAYPPGLNFVKALFGCFYAGVLPVPVYPAKGAADWDRLEGIASDCGARVFLTDAQGAEGLAGAEAQRPALGRCRAVATDAIAAGDAAAWREPPLAPDAPAFLQYTSGSTGAPKGVIVSHRNLLHNLEMINRCFANTRESRGVIWLPPYHDMGLIGGILAPLFGALPVVLMAPMSFVKRPVRWLEAITKYHATSSGGPSFAFDLCTKRVTPEQREGLDLSSWEVAFNGAEPVRADVLDRFARAYEPYGFRRKAFYPCYGMAEATLMVTGVEHLSDAATETVDRAHLEEGRVAAAGPQRPGLTLVGCGRPHLGTRVLAVDPETCIERPAGAVGEIWVSGESVAKGYWGNAHLTQHTFRAHLANGEGPFLRTGDLGFLRRGEIFITGRLKELIILQGKNHYPFDIERTTEAAHPSLRAGGSAAFSIEVADEERLVVVQEVERAHLRELDGASVLADIRRALTEHHGVRAHAMALVRPMALPKTSSGKICRGQVRRMFLDGGLEILERG